jgi:hypothetical protein
MQRGGGGNSLRVAIATVVKLLTYMGVCGLTPETLRQCKFDSPEPVGASRPEPMNPKPMNLKPLGAGVGRDFSTR